MATLDKPETLNVGGRLSFNSLTAQAAYDSATRADSKLPVNQRPASPDEAKASALILLNAAGLDAVKKYLLDTVLPWFRQQVDAGDVKVKGLSAQQIDLIETNIKGDDFEAKMGRIPFTSISEKTAELAPSAVVGLTVKAYRPGSDFDQKAFVTAEEQLNTLPFAGKALFPIGETVFDLYSGSYVKATVSFWIGEINGNPYLACNSNAIVFWKDGPAFSGAGVDTEGMLSDDDDMFLDD